MNLLRRLAPALAGALLVAVPAPAQAITTTSTAAVVATETFVTATWLVPTDRPGRYRWFDAEVLQHQDPATGAVVSRNGSISVGTCRAEKQPSGRTGYACTGSVRFVTEKDGFEVASDGRTARLVVKRGARRWSVKWTADAVPSGVYRSETGCYGGGVTRTTSATGVFDGRRLSSEHQDAIPPRFWHGVAAGACGE